MRIVAVEYRLNTFVAVSTGVSPGKKVWFVDDVDPNGWSVPHRGKAGVTKYEKKRMLKLRAAGMVHREIAQEVGCSRAVVSRVIRGVPVGRLMIKNKMHSTPQEDINEIQKLSRSGWRNPVIAQWIGCTEETVRKYAPKKCAKNKRR